MNSLKPKKAPLLRDEDRHIEGEGINPLVWLALIALPIVMYIGGAIIGALTPTPALTPTELQALKKAPQVIEEPITRSGQRSSRGGRR